MADKPWTLPGLTVEQRAGALTHAFTLQKRSMKLKRMDMAAEALRAAIEDCALVAEAMAFDAIAARIRRLKEG